MKKKKQKGTIASSLWTLWVLYICILCTIYLFHEMHDRRDTLYIDQPCKSMFPTTHTKRARTFLFIFYSWRWCGTKLLLTTQDERTRTCACCPSSPDIVRSSNWWSVVDLDELRAVHGLRYLVRVRAAPAAAMVPAVAATPPAVAARVAAPAAAAARVATTPAVPAATATRVAATAVPVLDLRLLLLFGLCHSPTHSTDN